jgi:hypothetical protein
VRPGRSIGENPALSARAAAWFDLDGLPPMSANMRRRIELSAGDDTRTAFDTSGPAPADPPR